MISVKMAALRKMFVSSLLFILPLLGIVQTLDTFVTSGSQEIVPVLMWGSIDVNPVKTDENPALTRLESDQFEDTLVNKVSSHKPLVLLLIEENLSSEDFVIGDSSRPQIFSKLQHLSELSSTSIFYPSVHAPLPSIENLKTKGYKWVSYSSDSSSDLKSIEDDVPTIVAVSLDDALEGESRPELLQRHDSAIEKIYTKLHKKHSKILAIYTARFSSWSEAETHHRVRRLVQASEAKDVGNGTIIVDKDNKVMLYTKSFPVLNITGGSATELKKPTMVTVDERGQMQRLIVIYSDPQKITLRFRFNSMRSGYWSFSEVELSFPNATEYILRKSPVTVPFNFSYHCSAQDTVFKNDTIRLILKDFQFQPFLSKPKFDAAYDCVYFFTIPILSGLFVTTLLAIIMSWGLCMILDIKTMDRFDDPKGKTISINVSE